MTENIIRWESDGDGVVVLTMDHPQQSANTMDAAYVASMAATVDRLEAERDNITGVILTSAKKAFFAGADLNELATVTQDHAADFFALAQKIKADLRRLETLGGPVVAAINGSALGGGLEIALACHRRIAVAAPGVEIGLPEVNLGLLPGGGGITRTVRMLGIHRALSDVLLRGQRYTPSQAVEVGLIDEAVGTIEEMLAKSKEWIAANPEPTQPWDVRGFEIPGSAPSASSVAGTLPILPAQLRQQIKGRGLTAPAAIMSAAVEGAQVDFGTATTVESRYLTELATGPIAKNMIRTFFDQRHIASGGSRPSGYPEHKSRTVAVVGAGMMGSGIAYVCAKAGLDVILQDVTVHAARKGKAYSTRLVEKAVSGGRMSSAHAAQILARITPTDTLADAAGADLVIEAVFEDPTLKATVLGQVEEVVASDAVLGSNTSTLPISGLAHAVTRPEDFIGLHFFSPVDKMKLIEIVVGEQTSQATLAKAIDIAQQIRKVPIVVNDSRGFFTSRVFGKFLEEALAMVGEGLAPASIEQAGAQAGYPAPPLQLLDELSLTLLRRIRDETKTAAVAAGRGWTEHGSEAVVDRMIDQFGRAGRSSGAGFYAYEEGTRVGLWDGLTEHFGAPGHTIPFEDMMERMLFVEAIDAVRCLEEGVVRTVPDANIGSLLGIGFPAWTGGVIQYIEGYPGGPDAFIARAEDLGHRYGQRFIPPDSLRTGNFR
jgi:3-hydroxyacyl-CoA dehydrogenase / enoyl-CoA hydratase / 3-hydroxybutyryl-CoA epimerase